MVTSESESHLSGLDCDGVDSLRRLATEMAQHGKDVHVFAVLGKFAENYLRGDLCIVLKLNVTTRGDAYDINVRPVTADDKSIVHPRRVRRPVKIKDGVLRNFGRADNGHQDCVLVRNVEVMESVEGISLASGKYLKSFKHVFDGLAGRFYSIAGALKASPTVPRGEFQMAVLFAAVAADKFPSHVVEGGMKIVNSIAYYERPFGRHSFPEIDAKDCLSRLRVLIYGQGVGIGVYEGGESRIQIVDMMIGPINF